MGGCGGDGGTEPYTAPPVATPSPSPSSTPAPPVSQGTLTPPFAGKVAFLSRRGATERESLFVMNPDGTQVTPVPLTRPDGRPLDLRNKFAGGHFMNAAGTHFVFTVLAFFAGSGREGRTYLISADGSGVRDITALCDPGAGDSYSTLTDAVSLNADGSRLVFAYGDGFRVRSSVVTMRTDGGERTVRYAVTSSDARIESPVFAPDGETLYFIEAGPAEAGPDGVTRTPGAVRRLAPGAAEPVTLARVTRRSDDFRAPFSVGVSPDGGRLVFTSEEGASAEVFAVNTDGTGLVRLTQDPARDVHPAFTADGQKIVFGSDRGQNEEIYGMNPDGSGVTRLTFDITADKEPATRGRGGRGAR
jgi:Tol biopolymer transport system component